jgi:hypothetical protein
MLVIGTLGVFFLERAVLSDIINLRCWVTGLADEGQAGWVNQDCELLVGVENALQVSQ